MHCHGRVRVPGSWNQFAIPRCCNNVADIATLIHQPDAVVAVVGATDNPGKYGSVIYRDLKRKGFTVYPVNPNRASVDGDRTFPTLAELPEPPTVVNIVIPAVETLKVLDDARRLGYMDVWVQPGAESGEVMSYLEDYDFNYLAYACIMVHSRYQSAS